MRIGIVVDSACDLPRDFLDANGVRVLPITLRIGELLLEDQRDPAATQAFYARHLDRKGEDFAESIPYTAQQIEALFLERLVLDYDYVFCLTITATRSPIHAHATQAAQAILGKYKAVRRAAGLPERFGLAVLSTRNLFTGQAVPVAEAVRLIRLGGSPSEIGQRLARLIEHTHTYRGRAPGKRRAAQGAGGEAVQGADRAVQSSAQASGNAAMRPARPLPFGFAGAGGRRRYSAWEWNTHSRRLAPWRPSRAGKRSPAGCREHALMPADLFHIYKRASKKGDTSLGWSGYTLGTWLDVKPLLHCHRDVTTTVDKLRGYQTAVEALFARAAEQIRAGLDAPCVCLSYGGEPRVVARLPGYERLAEVADSHAVQLLVAPMSPTAAVNVGPGALSLAFAASGHRPQQGNLQ